MLIIVCTVRDVAAHADDERGAPHTNDLPGAIGRSEA